MAIKFEIQDSNSLEFDLSSTQNLEFGTRDIIEVRQSGDYPDLTNKPQINGVMLVGNKTTEELLIDVGVKSWNGQTGDVVYTPPEVPVQSVNGKTGDVVLNASDVGALPENTPIPSKTSDLQNDSGYITGITSSDVTSALGFTPYNATNPNGYVNATQAKNAAPVQSVNGKTGSVNLSASDVSALPDNTPIHNVPSGGTSGQVLTKSSNSDYALEWATPSGSVSSVNGQTGAVVLDAEDVGALPDDTVIPTKTSELTNDSGFIDADAAYGRAESAIGDYMDSQATLGVIVIGTQAALYNKSGDPISFLDAFDILTTNKKVVFVETIGSNWTVRQYTPTYADVATASITFTCVEDDTVYIVSLADEGNGLVGTYKTASLENEVFVAQYNVTTYAEVQTAVNSGKVVFCKYNNGFYPFYVYNSFDDTYEFTGVANSTVFIRLYVGTNNRWGMSNTIVVPTSRKVNNKALSADITLNASDVGALPDNTAIPSKTSDLTNDSNFITASQAPVQSVNGQTGAVNIQIPTVPTNVSAFINDAGYVVPKTATVELDYTEWVNNEQTVSVAGVTPTSNVIVSAANAYEVVQCSVFGVYCSGQGNGTLTFTCLTVPDSFIDMNILIL